MTELTPTERLHLAPMLTSPSPPASTRRSAIRRAVGSLPYRDSIGQGQDVRERGSKVRHRSEDLHVEAPSLDGPDGRMAMPVETTVAVSCL